MTKQEKINFAIICCALAGIVSAGALTVKTRNDLLPIADSLQTVLHDVRKLQVLDRRGVPLNVTYQNRWNVYDYVPLYEIPGFIKKSFIISEDKRFYHHEGPDWTARIHAAWENLVAFKVVRGASTITEQVARMLHPRPRTFWSRWLEGWEAGRLERRYNKEEIFEFYLNQVPYAGNRRGVAQAARYYFDRDLETLTRKEMLALVVLVRAPSAMNLYRGPEKLDPVIGRLAKTLADLKILGEDEPAKILREKIQLEKPSLFIHAPHFARKVLDRGQSGIYKNRNSIRTTLDGELQKKTQALLDRRLEDLAWRNVHNGAALVVDHTTGEILAWAVGNVLDEKTPGGFIDAVTAPRQPGSTLKPFLYALALESGWTAAKKIEDAPFAAPVGSGLHQFKNYSHLYYGPVTVREALGNSLNIPALKAARFVGSESFLNCLRRLGFDSLARHPDYYGDGLALGNGEVTLLELTQAYTVLARLGSFRKLRPLMDDPSENYSRSVFSPATSSLVADILSDPEARRLEFGGGGVLNFPVQTAVKTGTSNDYRDAWAVGFNHRYTVGIWMGNLDGTPTSGLTGSTGPGMALRGIFAELNKNATTRPLNLSANLIREDVCVESESNPAKKSCRNNTEWFVKQSESEEEHAGSVTKPIRLIQPTEGLHLAMDPRIPDDLEAFEFRIEGLRDEDRVEWAVDKVVMEKNGGGKYLWSLEKGEHTVRATVTREEKPFYEIGERQFLVK